MLREHGAQRPTVFEILNVVHRMRGSKSKFTYNVPSRSQLLPTEPSLPSSGTLDGLVSYRSSASTSHSQAPPPSTKSDKNAGVQAREKVLEAIAPLRRGRPAPVSLHHATGPSSPTREKVERKPLELEFNEAEDESWKAARGAVRGHRSGLGLTSPTTWPPPAASIDDAWNFARGGSGANVDKSKNRDRRKTVQGSMAGLSGFGDSFNDDLASSSTGVAGPWLTPQPSAKPVATSLRPQETTSRFLAPSKPRDAFDGLGISSDRAPPPTLGEVQKARTGLSVGATGTDPSSTKLAVPGRGTSVYQVSPSSPRPSPSPRLSSKAPSPAPPASTSWRPSHSPLPQSQSLPSAQKADLTAAEQRFPALEVLDRTFPSTTPSSALPLQPSHSTPTGQRLGSKFTQTRSRDSVIRSEQTTGVTAPESRDHRPPKNERTSASHLPAPSPSRLPRLPSRAPPPRRQTSLAVRPLPTAQEPKLEEPPSPAKIMGRPEPQDWLTGPEDDKGTGGGATLVLRDLPSKRSSVIVERAPEIPSPQEAVTVSNDRAPPSPLPSPSPSRKAPPSWSVDVKQIRADTGKGRFPLPSKPVLASVEPRESAPAPVDSWAPSHRRRDTTSTTSSEEGPEEATAFSPPRLPTTRQPVRVETKETGARRRRSRSKGRQGSVHELVDLWGGKDVRPKSSGGGGLSPGPKPVSREPEDITSPSKSSFLFPPADQPPKPRSASPQPLASPSISTDFTKREQPSPTRPSPRHRKQSTNGRDAGPPPSTSAGTATARPRPQSMFLNSPSTAAVKFPAPSLIDTSSTSLGVPAPDARAQRTRRTSISDMVQRYEAMGGNGSAAPSTPTTRPPATSTDSPAAPPGPVASLSRSMTTTHVSPTPRRNYLGTAVGLPGLSSSTEPSKKQLSTGLGVSDHRPRAAVEHVSPVGLPGLAVERKPSYGAAGRRSPTKIDYAGGLDAPARPVPSSRRSPSPAIAIPVVAAGDEAQQPPSSPEKPYQGVGRLIDQWQRKTADTDVPRSPVSRRRGGGAGTGATASPRRAGVVAGRGTQD
jgi:AP2-associated kinase